ncbi:hypothetical protein K470DRAFT_281652 [Piedraia hortae CBS 480.64]|uniref:Uncharacterized protein n=1 Tax=Piedraia hortae CBS 480.64 TaxID=1314780 RepID=A0A6A7C2C1_9PEZI|nr:hypothetical protein K470DRAFT_281652 [Piedraia hortae CBS 480.64]
MPGKTAYGNFHDFCRDTGSRHSTLPVCNLFKESPVQGGRRPWYNGCSLLGVHLGGGRFLANLGSIIVAFLAVLTALFLLFRSNRKRAAVGRREMQMFLGSFMLVQICEILSVGHFPLNSSVQKAFSAIHIAAIVSTAWILMINALVGYQLLDDGTPLSIGLTFGSAAAFFIATGYIALDTGFDFTHTWNDSLTGQNRHYSLYTLYLLLPLVFLVLFFLLEAVLVLKVLGEKRPMIYLVSATLLFAIGQIFQFIASPHICRGTHGKINGSLFETLFTLAAVVMAWIFWDSITEDDWPSATGDGTY